MCLCECRRGHKDEGLPSSTAFDQDKNFRSVIVLISITAVQESIDESGAAL